MVRIPGARHKIVPEPRPEFGFEENRYAVGSAEEELPGLLENPDMRRWYDNVRRGSSIPADVYLRRLGSTRRRRGIGPKGLLVCAKSEERGGCTTF